MNSSKRTWDDFEESKDDESQQLNRVGTQELIGRFKSKQDIYTYFTEILGYYLPPIEGINRDYLRQILKGEKNLLKMSEVKLIKVPKYEELSVKQILYCIKDENEILKYFPDINDKSKPIERSFFFNIINSIQPDYLQHIIRQTQERRNNPQNDPARKDYILISDEWINQLTSHPFISKKNGRTLQLLKSSRKIFKARKPKENKQSVISLKRFKGLDGESSAFKSKLNLTQMETQSNIFIENSGIFNENNQTKNRFNI